MYVTTISNLKCHKNKIYRKMHLNLILQGLHIIYNLIQHEGLPCYLFGFISHLDYKNHFRNKKGYQNIIIS